MREYQVNLSEIVIEEKVDEKTKQKSYMFLENVDGCVIMKVPNYVDRLKLMESQAIDKLKDTTDINLGAVIKIVETCSKFIVSVNCKIDGEEITSFEDLGMFQQGVVVINHIFSILAGGIPSKKI